MSDQIQNFNLSQSEPKLIKLSLKRGNDLIDVKIIFESVHMKH